jgi:hypothetical protein
MIPPLLDDLTNLSTSLPTNRLLSLTKIQVSNTWYVQVLRPNRTGRVNWEIQLIPEINCCISTGSILCEHFHY